MRIRFLLVLKIGLTNLKFAFMMPVRAIQRRGDNYNMMIPSVETVGRWLAELLAVFWGVSGEIAICRSITQITQPSPWREVIWRPDVVIRGPGNMPALTASRTATEV